MQVKQVIAPTCEPVTIAEFKEELRLLTSGQDARLTRLLKAARLRAEAYCNRVFINSTWEATFAGWPPTWPHSCRDHSRFALRVLPLPRAALQAVTWVKYLDEDGAQQTLSSSAYTVDTDATPGRIVLKPSQTWPALGDYPNAVRVRFEAGYAATGTSGTAALQAAVPESVKLAIRFLAAHYFANPEPVNIGNITTPLPEHVHALLNDARVHSFGLPDEEAAA
jgi:uncharacterized phiE125 gp8 family phage protein